MRIKAIGTVTENAGDGKTIKVDWTRLDPFKTWFGPGVLREAIHRVDASDGYIKKQLLAFTFGDEEQDYGYEEFIQGLRPDTKSGKMAFITVDGVFKRIADDALDNHEKNYVIIIDEINRANISSALLEIPERA